MKKLILILPLLVLILTGCSSSESITYRSGGSIIYQDGKYIDLKIGEEVLEIGYNNFIPKKEVDKMIKSCEEVFKSDFPQYKDKEYEINQGVDTNCRIKISDKNDTKNAIIPNINFEYLYFDIK